MSDTKHTPGPWYIDGTPWRERDGLLEIRDVPERQAGRLIATVHQQPGHTRENARLIAAAPALVEALEAIYVKADSLQADPHKALAQIRLAARAALARAKE